MRRHDLYRGSALLLAVWAALLLSACTLADSGEETQPQGAYRVYYAVTGEQATVQVVDWEYRVPSGEDTASALAELVLSQPETAGLASPAPSGTRLLSCQQEDGQLRLDLSEQYGGLSGVDLTVANSCLTLTLCQLEGVEEVYITVEGEAIRLTPMEYNILLFLVKNAGKVFSIEQIYENIWNEEAIGVDNTVAVHIRHIREKIEINPKDPQYLKVVWGIGYKVEKI